MTVVDDYSRKLWVFILKSKDETFTKFKEWLVLTENQLDKKLKHLRTDITKDVNILMSNYIL